MKIGQYEIVKMINRDIDYAAKSYSKELMYQVLGFIEGLSVAEALPADMLLDFHASICKEYLNNPEWFHEMNRRDKI